METLYLQPGTLWPQVELTTANARRCGALKPIATELLLCVDSGIPFQVRILSSQKHKQQAQQRLKQAGQQHHNPFLPYDPQLFITRVTGSRLILLNKFNVVDHHLLIVSDQFEDQRSLLGLSDFYALSLTMAEFPSLGFYNSDTEAGASQRHRHLQVVPVPLSVPLTAAGSSATDVASVKADVLPTSGLQALGEGVDGRRAMIPIDIDVLNNTALGYEYRTISSLPREPQQRAVQLHGFYRHAITELALLPPQGPLIKPYNLLVCQDWAVIVPRRKERVAGVAINALGYAGAFLLRERSQLEPLRRLGLVNALVEAGVPASPDQPPGVP